MTERTFARKLGSHILWSQKRLLLFLLQSSEGTIRDKGHTLRSAAELAMITAMSRRNIIRLLGIFVHPSKVGCAALR